MDTVRYFPTIITFPKVSLADHLRQASGDIISILTNPPSQVTPELESGDAVQNAILKLAPIINTTDAISAIARVQTNELVPLPRVTVPKPPAKYLSQHLQKTQAKSALLPRVQATKRGTLLDKLP